MVSPLAQLLNASILRKQAQHDDRPDEPMVISRSQFEGLLAKRQLDLDLHHATDEEVAAALFAASASTGGVLKRVMIQAVMRLKRSGGGSLFQGTEAKNAGSQSQ